MNIKSITLWSKYTRLLHGSLAIAILFLAISGWLMGKIIDDSAFWAEWHQIVGQMIIFLLLARVVLFFQQGNSHYSRYKVGSKDTQTIKDTLKFYLSLARTPLPSWFAFNPVWRILYALFYILLILMVFSGLVNADSLVLGFYWPSIHQTLSTFINIWLVLHLLAVFIHDWKSSVGRISAILSGVAYFESDSGVNQPSTHENVIQTEFDLDIKKVVKNK